MKQVLWRLPLLLVVLSGAVPALGSETAPKAAAAAFVAAQDTARIEPHFPVLPLLTRGADTGGALRLVAFVVSAESARPGSPAVACVEVPQFRIHAEAALPDLGRAPPVSA